MGIIRKLFTRKLRRTYVSEVDTFLAEYNANYPQLSDSQLAVLKKYQRIDQLRDQTVTNATDAKLWDKF